MTTEFSTRVGRINDVLCAVNALQWDARVMMPAGGAASRGQQIATLKGLARSMILDPGLARAAEVVAASADPVQARAARDVLAARDHHARLSDDLLQEQAENSTLAAAAWAEARRTADFALFRPHLERCVAIARRTADALGYDDHPYDPLVGVFEPGETAASLSRLFDTLRSGLRPILAAAMARPAPRSDFLFRHFPKAAQQAFCAEIAGVLGYDYGRGRLDTTVHPFEVSFTRNDVRITSRWNENYLPMAIFGTIHETGHALYEQGIDPALTRTAHATDLPGLYAVGGTSFGMHESQSRLLENHVGRSAAFWQAHFGRLQAHFPDQLADVTAEEFAAAVNRTNPGLIRIEADELTYDFHIMLRVRMEMAMLDGSLAVADLPEAWNAAMAEDLGVTVPDDGMGCLQDVHWSHGYMGSFPTYTIGNITAAQLMAHLRSARPEVDAALAQGDTAPLRDALADLVWRHGRSQSRAEMMAAIGADAADPEPYLAYLRTKFA